MSYIVEEPENYEESSDDSQEDNHVPNSTTNGGPNWRGDPYSPRSELFSKAKRFTIKNGGFEAQDGNVIFKETSEFTIGGGRFNSTGHNYDRQRSDPNFRRSEMFTGSSRYTINDGEFTTTGNSSGFANNSDFVINGGNFVASSSTSHASMHYQAPMNHGTVQGNAPPRPYNGGNFGAFSSTSYASMHYQAPMNIGTAQGNAPPRPYQGHQGHDPISFPFGYTGNPPQLSNEFWQTSRPPAMHTRSSTLDGRFNNYTGSNPIRTAPIPPSHSEGYFFNKGKGRSNTGGGKRA